MSGIYSLKGVVKHYDWGGSTLIPDLLAIKNINNEPFAEYWMGTHSSGMSTLKTGEGERLLSDYSVTLSYLLKVLDVKKMLSIQVHPSIEGAIEGYQTEEEAGIPLEAPGRNYKDKNHKPELMIALSDFWLLHGFKPEEELIKTLNDIGELNFLIPMFNEKGYEGLYRYIMEMPQAEVNNRLQPLVNRMHEKHKDELPEKSSENFWVMRAIQDFSVGNDMDRGIFSIYLFNVVYLRTGEAIFQAAGVPHAYLEGWNVEIMANSDNVLRGGLTPKHIDVAQLLKHTKCEATYPKILQGENVSIHEKIFPVPVSDFNIHQLQLNKGDSVKITSQINEILLLTEGEVEVVAKDNSVLLAKGNPAAFVRERGEISLQAQEHSVLFRAY